jgi:hypothetical protein
MKALQDQGEIELLNERTETSVKDRCDYVVDISPKKDLVIQKVDEINSLFGNNTLIFGSSGIKKEWKIKSEKRSNRYTTCFNEILTIKI